MQIVLIPFVCGGHYMPRVGSLVDVPEPARSELIASGAIAEYEIKVDPLPEVTKKKRLGL